MTRRNAADLIGDMVLSLAAILGALGIVLVLAGATWGVRPLLFRSGSMSPTIDTGDLALSRSVAASGLRIGDIVSVLDASGERVTHRVVAIAGAGATRRLELRGDANATADRTPYVVAHADRVFVVVHGAGWLVAAAASPPGMFVLGLYVAGLLALLLRGSPAASRQPHAGHRRIRRPAAAAVALGAAVSVMPAGSADAAAWTDDVALAGQPLAAATVLPTTLSCSGSLLLQVDLSWTPVAGVTSYTVHYGAGGASTVTTSGTTATITGIVASGSAWVQVNQSWAASTWTSVASNVKPYAIVAAGVCS